MNECVSEWVSDLVSEWATDWMTDWLGELINEWVTEWWSDCASDCVSDWIVKKKYIEIMVNLVIFMKKWMSVNNMCLRSALADSLPMFIIVVYLIFGKLAGFLP